MTSLTAYLAEVSAREKAAGVVTWSESDCDSTRHGIEIFGEEVTIDSWDTIGQAIDLLADVPTLLAMVQAVVDAHRPVKFEGPYADSIIGPVCKECSDMDGHATFYPCPTIQAMTTAKEAGR